MLTEGIIKGMRQEARISGNVELTAAVAESGTSYTALARRVNELAARQGVLLRYDSGSVTRWLQGKQPRGRAAEFITEALSEKLGRPISPADLFGKDTSQTAASQALVWREDVAEALRIMAELGSRDVSRRSVLGAAPFVTGALVDPQRRWLLWLTELDEDLPSRLATASAGGVVEAVHNTIRSFDGIDNRSGGTHIRFAVIDYLTHQVVPLVRRGGQSEEERRELFTATARLAAMAGWSSYDAGEHGRAQVYMQHSLRLCQEGGDRVLGGQIWAGLSHLYTSLGHPGEGVHHARTGLATAKRSGSHLGLMRLHLMAARGYAAQGDTRSAHAALHAAEKAHAKSPGPEDQSPWVRYLDYHYFQAEAAAVWRDLGDGRQAEEMAADSVRHTDHRGRRQTIGQSVLATAHLQQGDLDAALASASIALERLGSGAVASQRAVQALRDFRARLEPLEGEETVRAFVATSRPVLDAPDPPV
ncbi:hypothetical protein AN218_22445 [Streptomyces nanshensis]|uniref:Transcriptional regulator n=2 Tax=Streptomyces nanshensis TaxID=518642 RepID=A0A1E7KZ83_9ACTN|nr:hypothetical protein AN218_22445 [Streptomyces nanshensis]